MSLLSDLFVDRFAETGQKSLFSLNLGSFLAMSEQTIPSKKKQDHRYLNGIRWLQYKKCPLHGGPLWADVLAAARAEEANEEAFWSHSWLVLPRWHRCLLMGQNGLEIAAVEPCNRNLPCKATAASLRQKSWISRVIKKHFPSLCSNHPLTELLSSLINMVWLHHRRVSFWYSKHENGYGGITCARAAGASL